MINKRKSENEYLQRLHLGIEATAIVKAFGAAFDKKDIKIEELIGKAPGEDSEPNTETVEQWKNNAKQRGLKTNS